ncbi:MAG: SAM-dependent methyltransferase [Actinomycetota bacterium]|nr:SAM-dependent methyltransferase [Actinomycetota bacterium]
MSEQAGLLLEELRERIRTDGPMTFRDYMEATLYHPEHGYYVNIVPGAGAHYATSPSVSSWFGRLVAQELRRMWETLDRPRPFTVVEVGAGQGDLALPAIEAAGPMADALRWRFIEPMPEVRKLQRRHLGEAITKAEWAADLDELPSVVGCIIANEVLDNFPVHVLQALGDGEVQEVYVDLDGDRLVERLGPLSDPGLKARAEEASPHLREGDRFEVSPALEEWCRKAARTLKRGYLLVIDYGDEEPDVWRLGPGGSVTTFGPNGKGKAPLDDPGTQDVTADLNFSALARAARAAGFDPKPIVNQGPWLLSLGLAEVAHNYFRSAKRAAEAGEDEKAVTLMAERAQVLKLAKEGGLGEAWVFLASKGAPLTWIQEEGAAES